MNLQIGWRLSGFVLATMLLGGCASIPEMPVIADGWVLDNVTVVDVVDGGLSPDRAIVIVGDRIDRIVPAGSVAVSGNARIVDGDDRYVIPGYNDMHSHNLNAASPETSLPMMVANGVTGFRQMVGADEQLARRAAGQPLMPPASPELLTLPGQVLAGPTVATPETAVAEVDRQQAKGVDFIKIVDASDAAFIAAADRAQALGLPLSGHLSNTLDPRRAIAHGMDSIEHMGPTVALLLSCSTAEPQIRAIFASAPPPQDHIDFAMAPEKLMRLIANPLLLIPPQGYGLIGKVIATYDDARCEALATDIAQSDAWVVPTFTRLEAMELGNDPTLRNNPDLRYVPAASRAMWRDVGDDFETKLTSEQKTILSSLFEKQLAMAKLFDDAGVKMMLGTDFGGQWIVPGESVHREFDLLARAGLSPLSILQMATINPAQYLGREGDMGTVAAGKLANLVVLTADPTQSAANLHQIDAVVLRGRYLERAELNRIKADVAAKLN